MTPERALEHDERTCSAPTCQPKNGFVCAEHRLGIALRALSNARQREEEAKGEIARLATRDKALTLACAVAQEMLDRKGIARPVDAMDLKEFPIPEAGAVRKCLLCAHEKRWGIFSTTSNETVCAECRDGLQERDTLHAENARLTLAASESARTLQGEIERQKVQMAESAAIVVKQTTAALQAQVTALREALKDMIDLAYGLIDDDSWFGERRNANERIDKAIAAFPQDGA